MERKKTFRVKPILLLILILCFQTSNFAEEKISVVDKVIGSTFKTLTKAFITANNINKLKKYSIDELNNMNEEKFKKRYAQVYEVIKNLPSKLKVSYGITEHMTKRGAIKDIESLNKKKIYEAIDSIPDAVIAEEFKDYLNEKKLQVQQSNLVEQINKFWDKVIGKVNISGTPYNPH